MKAWPIVLALAAFFLLTDLMLPWSLERYGYPFISPLLLWMPLLGAMALAFWIAVMVWVFLHAWAESRDTGVVAQPRIRKRWQRS